MTMVGGFDVHRKQITFDYVDDDGLLHFGEIRPAISGPASPPASHAVRQPLTRLSRIVLLRSGFRDTHR